MGKYTAFVDVGKTIIELFKEHLVPEPLEKPESIGMCSPNERGNFTVGIHLYDYFENSGFGKLEPRILPNGYIQNPPKSYSLCFMISVVSKAEVMIRTAEEARIIGKILQVVADNPVLPPEKMPESLRGNNEQIEIKTLNLKLEDKIRIWSMYNEPYKQSVFIDATPVLIESAVIKTPAKRVRVAGIENDFKNQIDNMGI